jgi:hypothetical protein
MKEFMLIVTDILTLYYRCAHLHPLRLPLWRSGPSESLIYSKQYSDEESLNSCKMYDTIVINLSGVVCNMASDYVVVNTNDWW